MCDLEATDAPIQVNDLKICTIQLNSLTDSARFFEIYSSFSSPTQMFNKCEESSVYQKYIVGRDEEKITSVGIEIDERHKT